MTALQAIPRDTVPVVERRSVQRYRVVGARAAAVSIGTARLPCLIEDLSAGGVRLHAGAPMVEALEVRLEGPGGAFVLGSCVWTTSDGAGIAFQPGLRALRFFVNYALGRCVAPGASMAEAPFL